ncbi:MAG: fibronectin type III domain-containing protein, partial [Acidobacteria bacterium]
MLLACLAALAACAAAPDGARAGGFYRVAECAPGHPDTPDASVQGATAAYSASSSCASGNWLQVQSGAAAAAGAAKQWTYTAPPGTRIEEFEADYNLVGDPEPDGNRSYLFVRRHGEAGPENLSVVGLGSTTGTYDSSLQDLGPFDAVGIGVFCSKPSGSCGYAPGQFARLARMTFLVEDRTPPGTPVVAGPAADGEWVGGVTDVALAETDTGSGVHRTTVDVGGVEVAAEAVCEPGLDGSGLVGSMAPCDPIELRHLPIDTAAVGFEQGENAVRFCTHEFGFGAASTCTTETFRVDGVAPGPPGGLAVAGGEGWHRDPAFDLSWTNPPQAHAPIAAATVRVTGPGGYEWSATRSEPGIATLEDVTVPAPGAYTAAVHLRDAAGNGSPAATATATLRFDDAVPPRSTPEKSNGWISRRELQGGFTQRWRRPSDEQIPVSGIAGYRTAVSGSPDLDPCAGAGDPGACPGPLTEVGIDSTSRLLGPGDLGEGRSWFHVVAVSGSGMRSAAERVPLDVDLTDPVTAIAGAGPGWVNGPVALSARAEDGLSGMADTGDYPGDEPPRTALAIDGTVHSEPGADIAATVAGEGVHRVEYWARDLAGNENDGAAGNAAPGSATVRIDTTAPAVAFTGSQDPRDPDRLEAPVSDALSGVASGRISYRAGGDPAWTALPTTLAGGRLRARIDSEELDPGTRYEFRAEATDRAGNSASSTLRGDGTPMATVGPFRARPSFAALTVNGRPRAKLGYGGRPRASGRLLTAAGAPIAGARVELIEAYAAGSRRPARTTVVGT